MTWCIHGMHSLIIFIDTCTYKHVLFQGYNDRSHWNDKFRWKKATRWTNAGTVTDCFTIPMHTHLLSCSCIVLIMLVHGYSLYSISTGRNAWNHEVTVLVCLVSETQKRVPGWFVLHFKQSCRIQYSHSIKYFRHIISCLFHSQLKKSLKQQLKELQKAQKRIDELETRQSHQIEELERQMKALLKKKWIRCCMHVCLADNYNIAKLNSIRSA